MASNPVILFVPGSFAPAKLYTTVVETIKSAGYEVEIYDLPSASRTPPQKSADMYEDAALFREKALDIIQSGKTVLLIAHSYGGLVASEAIKGLHTDAKTGPAVVGFVALAALLIPVGVSLKAGMSEPPAYLKIEGEYMYLEHQESADSNFSDLPHEQGVEESKKFSMHSVSSYASELSYAGYWSVPLAYIKTTLDKVVPPEGQQGMIDFVSQGGEYKVDVHEFASGHNPHASQPENIGKILVKAVEGLLARGA